MKEGKCRLCQQYGKLSYEHVPPEAAYNAKRIFRTKLSSLVERESPDITSLSGAKKFQQQRGAGGYTLCEQCNSSTGSWYGTSYVDFIRKIYKSCIISCRPDYMLKIECSCFPLRIIKQILVMFCSNCPGLAENREDLTKFLMNKNSVYFPSDIGIWASVFDLNNSTMTCQSGIFASVDLFDVYKCPQLLSQISFPPLNLIMTLDNSQPPNDKMSCITPLKNFGYNQEVLVTFYFQSNPVNTYIPGDFRYLDEILPP